MLRELDVLTDDQLKKIRPALLADGDVLTNRRALGDVFFKMLRHGVPPDRFQSWTTQFVEERLSRKTKADELSRRAFTEYSLHHIDDQKFVLGLTAFLQGQMTYVKRKFRDTRTPQRLGREFALDICGERRVLAGVGTVAERDEIEAREAAQREAKISAIKKQKSASAKRAAETRKRNKLDKEIAPKTCGGTIAAK